MRIDFYHLSATPIERALPGLCEKVLAGEGRLVVVADEAQLGMLDSELWAYSPDSFLPHGRSDGPAPEAQSILLSPVAEAPNGARNLAIADGKWREEALGFDRIFYFFGAETLDAARAAWRALEERPETERRYWKQEGGKWVEGP